MDRRSLLRQAVGVVIIGIAGCSSGGESGRNSPAPDGDDDQTEAPQTTSSEVTGTPEPTEVPEPSPTPPLDSSPTEPDENTPTNQETPQSTPQPDDTPTETPAPATPTPESETGATVKVGPDGRLRFQPNTVEITAGEQIKWLWESGGHNVKPSSTPPDSDWTGTRGEEFETFDADYTYTETFTVPGTYEYYCAPHRSSGMTGNFTVE